MNQKLSVPSVQSVVRIPSLKFGDPDEVAAKFKTMFGIAEDAKLRVAAFGIYGLYIKLILLKHGQFSAWVMSQVGQEHYRTVRDHIQFAKSTLERVGHAKLKALLSKWQGLPICHSGEFLLLSSAARRASCRN